MARIFQDTQQKRKLGKKAPWYVEWRQNGRRFSVQVGSKTKAVEYAKRKDIDIKDANLGLPSNKLWVEFRNEYEDKIVPTMRSVRSHAEVKHALDLFETVVRPKQVRFIDSKTLAEYVAKRLKMPGKKRGDTVSAETVKKEIRTIRAALRVAVDWKYLAEVPPQPKIETFGCEKQFVTTEHFELILKALEAVRLPKDQHYAPSDWWRAALLTLWVTGMRIGALLELRWDDLDLEMGIAISRARHNKSKKDKRHRILGAVGVLERLRRVRRPGECRVFPWNHDRTTLMNEFARLQRAAGVHLHCPGDHEHTPKCHVYGFHGFRYAHATYNYGRVTDGELQEQMGHASFQTTQRYVKFAKEHQERAYDVFLPDSLRKAASGG